MSSGIKKLLIAIALIVGAIIAYWLIAPLFITTEVSEDISTINAGADMTIDRQGTFIGLENHRGSGTASLIKGDDGYYVRFEDNFQVTNGPDLFVYLGKDDQYDPDARLARLKGSKGSQNYQIPADLDPANFNEVWVWCRAFSTPFAKAVLQ